MRKTSDIHIKKLTIIAIFIFLFGLFSGLFFSTGLSEDNTEHLSSLFISSITDPSVGFFRIFFSSLFSNALFAALMMSAVLTSLLCFLPFVVLWYKSFAIGFCCGLIHISGAENAISLSLTEILPPALFFVPAFIILAAVSSSCSKNQLLKSKRLSREGKPLINMIFLSLAAMAAGCITEALCSLF